MPKMFGKGKKGTGDKKQGEDIEAGSLLPESEAAPSSPVPEPPPKKKGGLFGRNAKKNKVAAQNSAPQDTANDDGSPSPSGQAGETPRDAGKGRGRGKRSQSAGEADDNENSAANRGGGGGGGTTASGGDKRGKGVKSRSDKDLDEELEEAVEQVRENYIPLRYPDMRDRLIHKYGDVFSNGASATSEFKNFCDKMELRTRVRLAVQYGDLTDTYTFLDPDVDTVSMVPRDVQQSMLALSEFQEHFDEVLEDAGFQKVPPAWLARAQAEVGAKGLGVRPPPDDIIWYQLHFRGTRTREVRVRSWRACFKKVTVEQDVLQRLCIIFRVLDPDDPEVLENEHGAVTGGDEDTSVKVTKRQSLTGRRARKKVLKNVNKDARPEWLFMKMFKDVAVEDVDMLLPGSSVRFVWTDYCLIWIPVLAGAIAAIYKAATGTFAFDTMVNTATTLVLIVMPLSYGVKAYMKIKDKESDYKAHLNNIFLMHNLTNNAGVLTTLLDEVAEQEMKENMLAYFFAWMGMQKPEPILRTKLDASVEGFLKNELKGVEAADGEPLQVDFQVGDALGDLERMGIVKVLKPANGGEQQVVAVPLAQANALTDISKFSEAEADAAKFKTATKRMGRRAAAPPKGSAAAWVEKSAVFPSTGQPVKYYFNTETGESSYVQPAGFAGDPASP